VDFDLAISASEGGLEDDPDACFACHARIMRVDPGDPGKRPPGFCATIEPADDDNRDRLTELLLRAAHNSEGDDRD